jgi:hypothetical protein
MTHPYPVPSATYIGVAVSFVGSESSVLYLLQTRAGPGLGLDSLKNHPFTLTRIPCIALDDQLKG